MTQNIEVKDVTSPPPGINCVQCSNPAISTVIWEQGDKSFTVSYCMEHLRAVLPPDYFKT